MDKLKFKEDLSLGNTKQPLVFDLVQLFKNYRAISINVCFEVPCFSEVHLPVGQLMHELLGLKRSCTTRNLDIQLAPLFEGCIKLSIFCAFFPSE